VPACTMMLHARLPFNGVRGTTGQYVHNPNDMDEENVLFSRR
jgi:hypothetical protein